MPLTSTRTALVRHRWLDSGLTCKGPSARHLASRVLDVVRHEETVRGSRKRQRRAYDQALHERRVDLVVANLAHAVLMPPETGRLATLVGHRGRDKVTRYDHRALGKPYSSLLWQLSELDILDLDHSTERGQACSIAPTPWFAGKVREAGVSLDDLGRGRDKEVILLSGKSELPSDSATVRDVRKHNVDYVDTAETVRLREEMESLNAFLADADIAFVPDDGPQVDPYARHLRRHFVLLEGQAPRFDQCGRLFGGFWLTMKSKRRAGIRINGEPVVDLDYKSMFTRLAYLEAGTVPPEGDLYAIPGLEGYRSGVKLAINCLLYANGPRKTWPDAMAVGRGPDGVDLGEREGDVDGRLPARWGVSKTKTAILKRHPALKAVLNTGIGHRLMYRESCILMTALGRLMGKGIPALPLHDGLLVATSAAQEAEGVMKAAAQEVVGFPLPVAFKG